MRFCIIGWYGTETLGDRAILAGLVSLFRDANAQIEIDIGSIFPFFTKRTILEDSAFLIQCAEPSSIKTTTFNSMDPTELKQHILSANALIIGGGPLMDLSEMHMLSYAISFARRKRIPSLSLGIGWGPIKQAEFLICAKNIITNSETIFRDKESSDSAYNAGCGRHTFATDPAIFACDVFSQHNKSKRTDDFVCVNLREPTHEYGINIDDLKFVNLISKACKCAKCVKLVPMHSFYIGGDDRYFLNRIKFTVNASNVDVVNDPPSLSMVMDLFSSAKFCIGMRYHSIVLQSCLNGRNYILNYTNRTTGKISNFCRSFLTDEILLSNVRNINDADYNFDLEHIIKRKFPEEQIASSRNTYKHVLKGLI